MTARSHLIPILVAMSLACAALGCDRSRAVPLRSPEDAGRPDAPVSALRLRGVTPLRGPHTGETVVVVDGAGFVEGSTLLRVDGVELAPERVTLVGAGRLAVRMPPHPPGVVDLSVRVGAATASLADAYTFDALAFEPSEAPVEGGQRVSILGAETEFAAGDVFEFDSAPCTELVVVSRTEAQCRVPAHGVGRVDVVQRRGREVRATAVEAFEYVDAVFVTGGVSGEAIGGSLRVEVVGPAGPVADALVRLDDMPIPAREARTDSLGRVVFEDAALRGPVSVHVGHECYSRTSIVGVDARFLVVPLQLHRFGGGCPEAPVGSLTPGPPGGVARGSVVFVEGQEFPTPTRRWVGLPEPRADEQVAAYVWARVSASAFDEDGRELPYFDRVTPEDFDEGRGGIPVVVGSAPGTSVLCAVAGIEPRDSETTVVRDGIEYVRSEAFGALERFTFGCSAPFFVPPGGVSEEVTIEMNGRLSDILQVDVEPLPALDIPSAIAPGAFDVSISPSVEVFLGSFIPFLPEEEVRSRAASAPFTARFDRRPSGGDPDVEGSGILGFVLWGDRSSLLLRRVAGTSRYVARPLGIPRFLAPTQGGSFGGRALRLAIDGEASANLLQIRVSPERYTPGTGSPRWFVYARGDRREVRLPETSTPELDLAPGLYEIDVAADERERFEFDAWAFASLRTPPLRSSVNRVYARVEGGGP